MVEEAQNTSGPLAGTRPGAPRRRGRLRRFLRLGGLVFVLVLALFVGGFLYFANMVGSMLPPEGIKADGIVVLTGGSQRLKLALDLLGKGMGQRLLISGVHQSTTPQQLRRLTRSSSAMFNCCVDMGYEALDTIGNAQETVGWISEHGYRRVLVVTNNYHMPRSLIELRRADPQTEFIAYPVINSNLKTRNWLADRNTLRILISEYVKIIATGLRGMTGLSNFPGPYPHSVREKASMGG